MNQSFKTKRLTFKVEAAIPPMIDELVDASMEYENASQLMRGLIRKAYASHQMMRNIQQR